MAMLISTCAIASFSAMSTICPSAADRAFAKDASGIVNQILGNWQMTGVFSAATGNYYTATDTNPVSNTDCGGTVGYYCSRPALVGNPNAKPCVPGTLFNTCAFAAYHAIQGTFGNARRNTLGPRIQDLGHLAGQTVSDSASRSTSNSARNSSTYSTM